MPRTPVHVRGKKTKMQKISQVHHSIKMSTSSASRSAGTSRSRVSNPSPPKRRVSDEQSLTEFNEHESPRKTPRNAKLSLLEQLPNELLQETFILSANPELPGASLNLARRLSETTLHLSMCSKVFYKPLPNLDIDWSERTPGIPPWGLPDEREQYRAAKHAIMEKLGLERRNAFRNAYMQSRLLAARFFTWPFFVNLVRLCHPMYQQHIKALHEHTQGTWEPDWRPEVSAWYMSDVPQHTNDQSMREWITNDWGFPRIPWFRMCSGVTLPHDLANGPWDNGGETLSLLVYRGGVGFRRSRQFYTVLQSRIPVEALENAIETNRPWLVYHFLLFLDFFPVTLKMLRLALNVNPFPYTIIENILHAACRWGVHKDMDLLDQAVFEKLEQLEERDAQLAKNINEITPAADCVSASRWLRHQLQVDLEVFPRGRTSRKGFRHGCPEWEENRAYRPGQTMFENLTRETLREAKRLHPNSEVGIVPTYDMPLAEFRETRMWTYWTKYLYRTALKGPSADASGNQCHP
jgi:hypothetical protein